MSYYGTKLGYIQRHYKHLNDWWSGPKAINIIEDTKQPWCHFPNPSDITDTLVVVEDWPSAETVANYVPSCALLGTNLTAAHAGLFIKIGIKHLIICLDNDALAKAAKLKRKYSLTFDKVSVIFVDKDPKDMTEEELVTYFGGI